MSNGSSIDLLKAVTNIDPHPDTRQNETLVVSDSALVGNVGLNSTKDELHEHNSSDTNVSTGGGEIIEYVVKDGDTLSEIAESFGVSTKTLLWANDLTSANGIRPGTTLIILPVSGIKHTVKSGDTLSSLAKRYDAVPSEIASFNKLDADATLVVGKDLIIPGGELQAPAKKIANRPSTPSVSKPSGKTVPFTAGGFFANPLPGGRLSQGIHGYNGADVAAPAGTPIYAAADGKVLISRDGWNGGYGNYVVIKHNNGTQTVYSHMSTRAISSGSVSQGDVIGYVGNTGKSTGNHLHFEVRGGRNPFAL